MLFIRWYIYFQGKFINRYMIGFRHFLNDLEFLYEAEDGNLTTVTSTQANSNMPPPNAPNGRYLIRSKSNGQVYEVKKFKDDKHELVDPSEKTTRTTKPPTPKEDGTISKRGRKSRRDIAEEKRKSLITAPMDADVRAEIRSRLEDSIKDSGLEVIYRKVLGRTFVLGKNPKTGDLIVYDWDGKTYAWDEFFQVQKDRRKEIDKLNRVHKTDLYLDGLYKETDAEIRSMTLSQEPKFKLMTDSNDVRYKLTRSFPVVQNSQGEDIISDGRFKGYRLQDMINRAGRMVSGTAYNWNPETGQTEKIEIGTGTKEQKFRVRHEPYVTTNEAGSFHIVLPEGDKATNAKLRTLAKTMKSLKPGAEKDSKSWTFEGTDFDRVQEVVQAFSMSETASAVVESMMESRREVARQEMEKDYGSISTNSIEGMRGVDEGGREFFAHQKKAIGFLTERGYGQGKLVGMGTGTGKANTLDTKILTPNGWTTMRDVYIGQEIMCPDGSTSNIIAIHPQGKKDVYKITFSDGSSAKCCEEHLWDTMSWNDRRNNSRGLRRKYSTKTTKEISQTIHHIGGQKNHNIPMVEKINFNNEELFIHPYIMGFLLGDGGITRTTTFTTGDDFCANKIASYLPDCYKVNNNKTKYDFSIVSDEGSNLITTKIKNMEVNCKSENKFIPEEYKFTTYENRLLLLQGLMDADGTVDNRGYHCSYSTSSEKLKSDVVELVQSLGGIATVTTKIPYYINVDGDKVVCLKNYIVTININDCPFLLPRKVNLLKPKTKYSPKRYITSIEYVSFEECQCITINHPDHRYIIDDYIVTHNSGVAIGQFMTWKNDGTLEKDGKNGKALFVVPASLKGNIPGDMLNFLKDAKSLKGSYEVVSYGMFAKDPNKWSKYGAIFFDEAQAIKNPDTDAAQAAFSFDHPRKVPMTASILEKNPLDMFMMIEMSRGRALNKEELNAKRKVFEKNFCEKVGTKVVGLKEDPATIGAFAKYAKANTVFIQKTEVEEMPLPTATPPSDQTVSISMTGEIRKKYEELSEPIRDTMKRMAEKFESGDLTTKDLNQEKSRVMADLQKLRRFSNHPDEFVEGAENPKVEYFKNYVREKLTQSNSAKVISFTDNPDLAVKTGKQTSLEFPEKRHVVGLAGEIIVFQNGEQVESYRPSSKYKTKDGDKVPKDEWQVHILSTLKDKGDVATMNLTKAYTTGHNLQNFNSVINLDRDTWNARSMEQREARAWRTGQKGHVDIQVVDLVLDDGSSINEIEKFSQRIEDKVFNQVVDAIKTADIQDEEQRVDIEALIKNKEALEWNLMPSISNRSKVKELTPYVALNKNQQDSFIKGVTL